MRRAFVPLRRRQLEVTISLGIFLVCSGLTILAALSAYFVEPPTWMWVLWLGGIVVTPFIGSFFISWLRRAYWNVFAIEPGVARFDHRPVTNSRGMSSPTGSTARLSPARPSSSGRSASNARSATL